MSLEEGFIIVTFFTSHAAIRAEREMRTRGLGTELIPVPREISSACGFCLRLPERDDPLGAVAGIERESIWKASGLLDPGFRGRKYERIG